MRSLTRFLAKLYPPCWRQRYGTEFDALLEDTKPDAETAFNVFSGAISMQIRTWNFAKILAAAGLAGILIAVAIASAMPKRYVAKALVKFSSSAPTAGTQENFTTIVTNVVSPNALTRIMIRGGLYPSERSKMRLEDGVDQMHKDISVSRRGPDTYAIEFRDSDPALAKMVTNELAGLLIDAMIRRRELFRIEKDGQLVSQGWRVQVLNPASLPQRPVFPNYKSFAAIGLAGGLALGATFALFFRRQRATSSPE